MSEDAVVVRCCKSCRWWNIHSFPVRKSTLGDCMNEYGHGYARVPMGDGSFAMIDTFGKPETGPKHVCEQWESPNV